MPWGEREGVDQWEGGEVGMGGRKGGEGSEGLVRMEGWRERREVEGEEGGGGKEHTTHENSRDISCTKMFSCGYQISHQFTAYISHTQIPEILTRFTNTAYSPRGQCRMTPQFEFVNYPIVGRFEEHCRDSIGTFIASGLNMTL